MSIATYEDSSKKFKVRAITDERGTYYVAQDIARSAGWVAQTGKPSPTREIPANCKTVRKIQETSSVAGKTLVYEVLCLNAKGVWLLVDAIKKFVYKPITSEFLTWFEQEVLKPKD